MVSINSTKIILSRVDPESDRNLKNIYRSALFYSFGENFAGGQTIGSSFVNMYAIELGASPTQVGLFHSITISVQSIFQLLWGRMSDIFGKRVSFILLGGLGYSIIWLPILYAGSPEFLLIFLFFQAIFASIRMPTWTSLIGDVSPVETRGKVTANIGFYSTISGLFAIIAAGTIMFYSVGSIRDIYSIPFIAATIFGVIGTIMILSIKEPRDNVNSGKPYSGITDLISSIKRNKDYQRYLSVAFLSNTSLVLLLPVISLTTIQVLKADKITFALYGVVRCGSLLFFQKFIGRIVDLTGRKNIMFIQRVIYIIIPSLFVFAPNKYFIFFPYLILGFLHAIEGTANLSYLLDVVPHQDRGSYISIFNAIQGVGTFISSLMGGYLIEFFSTESNLIESLKVVAFITTLARIPTALAYITLRETRAYPSNLKSELLKLIKR